MRPSQVYPLYTTVFLITKSFMLDVKGFLDSPLDTIHQTCKSSQIIILNVFQYKVPRILQFWYKSNTHKIVKTCPFRFLYNCYGDSLDVTLLQFSNHFLLFPMVFPHVSISVSTISLGVSTVSPQYFPRFLFQILRLISLLLLMSMANWTPNIVIVYYINDIMVFGKYQKIFFWKMS